MLSLGADLLFRDVPQDKILFSIVPRINVEELCA